MNIILAISMSLMLPNRLVNATDIGGDLEKLLKKEGGVKVTRIAFGQHTLTVQEVTVDFDPTGDGVKPVPISVTGYVRNLKEKLAGVFEITAKTQDEGVHRTRINTLEFKKWTFLVITKADRSTGKKSDSMKMLMAPNSKLIRTDQLIWEDGDCPDWKQMCDSGRNPMTEYKFMYSWEQFRDRDEVGELSVCFEKGAYYQRGGAKTDVLSKNNHRVKMFMDDLFPAFFKNQKKKGDIDISMEDTDHWRRIAVQKRMKQEETGERKVVQKEQEKALEELMKKNKEEMARLTPEN